VVTGGSERLEVNNSQVTVQNANFDVDDGDVRSRGAGFRNATGNYGTIRVDDDRSVSWAGYAIRNDWVFMSDGANRSGIYNDTDNDWAIRFNRNAEVELYHNGSQKLQTTSGGVSVSGNVSANSFSGDGSNLSNLPAAPVPTSDNPPSSPSDGQLWWDSSEGNLYVYYTDGDSAQWVSAASVQNGEDGQGVPPGGGENQFLIKGTNSDYVTVWSSDLNASSVDTDSLTVNNNATVSGDLTVNGTINGGPVAFKTFMINNSNVNDTTTPTVRSVFNTTPDINSGGFSVNSTDITVPESGIYTVSFNCYFTSGSSRANVGVSVDINGTQQGEYSASDYIRASSGHNEASTGLTALYSLSANDEISLRFFRHADGGTVTLEGPESSISVYKL
jgi:phage baseplate assembly protein gpV